MLNRVFSRREKVLLVILAVIIIAAAYYFLVQVPVSNTVPQADAIVAEYDTQAQVLQARYDKMIMMQDELAHMKESDKQSEIPQYDNLSQVISFLNAILSGMNDYEAKFNDAVVGDDGIARRAVQVSFTAPSYKAATDAVADLQNCPFLSRIDGVSITPIDSRDTVTGSSRLNVSATILFYETVR